MRDAGRLSAAIAVLGDIEERHKPVRMALKNWGEASRFAGAKDRACVSGLVLDVLRRRRSLGWLIGDDSPRAAALAVLRWGWDWSVERIAEAAAEAPHGPGALSVAEARAMESPRSLEAAPAPVRGDYPDWLDAPLARAFGDDRAVETAALAQRAPVDLRANTLKADRARVQKALASLGAEPTGLLVNAIRVAAPMASERAAAVESAPEFAKGWFEVQDLGSQIAAASAGDIKGRQVLDYCAGGGGKTLALSAAMQSTGQIYAYDSDGRRLQDTVTRSQRDGVRNLQVRSPLDPAALEDLIGRMDVVFVDAPCTGSGTWRRHPDAKWRLTPAQLERRQAEQDAVLAGAGAYVRPGGRLVYATCSLLMEENEDRIDAFLAATPEFAVQSALASVVASGQLETGAADRLAACETSRGFLRLSPLTLDADGFFIAVLARAA